MPAPDSRVSSDSALGCPSDRGRFDGDSVEGWVPAALSGSSGLYGWFMDWAWVRLVLDAEAFDAEAFVEIVERCVRDGIRFTTIAALGDFDANHQRLYELNRTCSADIPERGEFYTYAEYRSERIKVPSYEPSTVVIALDGEDWVGMSVASDHRDAGYFFNEMTGVLQSHRGRGIAIAMKVAVIERVRELGVSTIRTFHHPDNAAPIALNRRLGYVDAEVLPPTP
jgi:RimJ/RimL family protein N-acetyltransferase